MSKVDAKVFVIQKALAEIEAPSALDPWSDVKDYDDTIAPPFSKHHLSRIIDHRGKARGALDAIAVNTSMFGGRLVPKPGVDEGSEAAIEAKLAGENFINNIGSGGVSLSAIRLALAQDLNRTGEAYLEVLCNARGKPVQVNQVRSPYIRITTESELVQVRRTIVEDWGKGPEVKVRLERVRFRRYVQRLENGQIRYFKDWGDPRTIDANTGLVDPNTKSRATALIRFSFYCSWTPYGIPPWTAALIEVLGAREASELNKGTMDSNAIPAMAMLVSGGRFTDGTISRIGEFIRHKGQTKDSFSGILLMEAEKESPDDPGQVKVDIQPLTGEQRTDALFVGYQKDADEQMLASVRVPEIFVGIQKTDSKGIESIRRLADEQVFAPARQAFDDVFNAMLLVHYCKGLYHHVSRTPNVTDSSTQATMIATLERTGGISPEIARKVAEDIFPTATEGTKLSPEIDPLLPYSFQLAQAVKKNNGGKDKSTGKEFGEPNQSGPPVLPPLAPSPDGNQKK